MSYLYSCHRATERGREGVGRYCGWLHVFLTSLSFRCVLADIPNLDHTITMLRVFVLPSWFGGQMTSFKPTGSLSSELKERNPRERAPLFRRLKVILWNYSGLFHLLYILFIVTAVTKSSARCSIQPTRNDQLICLLTHAFWPPVSWLVYVTAAWTPIIYALSPPAVPNNEDLLDLDPKTNVAYPKEDSKKIKNKFSNVYFEVQYMFMTVYVTTIFVGSWVY